MSVWFYIFFVKNKQSLFFQTVLYSWHKEIFNKQLDQLVEGKFGADLPSMTELEQRTGIAFVNTNPAFDHVTSLPENVIQVGGLQIKDPKPLPQVNASITDIQFKCNLQKLSF